MSKNAQASAQTMMHEEDSASSHVQWADEYGSKLFFSQDFLSNWRSFIESFIDGNGNSDKSAAEADTVERMINANGVFMLLNDFWKTAFKELPKLNEVKNDKDKSQEIIDGWLEQYQTFFEKHTGMVLNGEIEQIINTWMNILQLHHNAAGRIFNPWIESLSDWGKVSEKFAQGDLSALDQGFHLWLDTYNDTIGKALNMPSLGLTKQHAEKFKRVHAEFTQFTSSLPFLHQYIYQTGISAMKEVFEKVKAAELESPTPENLREIYDIWLMTNEKAFFQLFQRPDFCATTGEIIHSSLRIKRQLDDLTATWCTTMSIPTSRDHDKMAMAIQELRRKVRTQEKAIEALQQKVKEI